MLLRIRNRKGFTLIELICVIAILGILALFIVPRIAHYYFDGARVSRAKTDLTEVKNAIARYNFDHGVQLPSAPAQTLSSVQAELTTEIAGMGPYISSIPTEWAGVAIEKIIAGDPINVDVTDFTGDVIDPSAAF